MKRPNRHFTPGSEALEPRIALSTYPTGFIGPIPPAALAAPLELAPPAVTVKMTHTPKGPVVLGNGFTENLTIDNPGPSVAVLTTWSWTVTYKGFVTLPIVSGVGSLTSCQFYASIPGKYTVTAVTTYAVLGWTPYITPSPTTATDTINVAPADSFTKGGAINTPVPFGTAVNILDTVNTAAGPMGPQVSANVQERISSVRFSDGSTGRGSGGWTSDTLATLDLIQGKVSDVMSLEIPRKAWMDTPIGGVAMTASQSLRLVWTLPSIPVAGGPFLDNTFISDLGTQSWSFIKVSPRSWMVR